MKTLSSSALFAVGLPLFCSLPQAHAQFMMPIETEGDDTINVLLRNPENSKLATKDQLKADVDFHTDVKVLEFLEALTDGSGTIVKVSGKVGQAIDFGGGMSSVAGLPGTRLDISAIKGEFLYAGARWKPTGKHKAIIICIKEGIVGINVDRLGPLGATEDNKPQKFDPADLEALSGKKVRWAGSVTKLETDGHKCTVLLSSKEDDRGNKTLYVVSLPVPRDTGAKPRPGDTVVFEGVLQQGAIVKERGFFKDHFDKVSEKTITLLLAEPTILSIETKSEHPVATVETVEAIETTIALSIKPFSFNPCPISDRLQGLIKKYDLETAFGVARAGYAATMKEKGVAIELKDDWGMPFVFKSDKLPEVKFRRGQIGIVAEEIYVKEGTEALVGGKTYQYKGQKWLAVEGQPAKKTGK